MNTFLKKIKLLFFPYLLVVLGFVIGYSFLHWLLFIKLEVYPLNETIYKFIVPFIGVFLVTHFWLKPKFEILNLKTKRGTWADFYWYISSLLIVAPTLMAQFYVQTVTGNLVPLENITQITKEKKQKYYTLQNKYIDKKNIGVQTHFVVSGKNNASLIMHIYVAQPIFEKIEDTSQKKCVAWLGLEYQESISNFLEQKEKEDLYEKFANECEKDFDSIKTDQFIYLERVSPSDDLNEYINALKRSSKYNSDYTTVLLPVNKPYDKKDGGLHIIIIGTCLFGLVVWLIMICIPKFDEEQLDYFLKNPPKTIDEIKDVLSFFVPKNESFVTTIIMDINLLIFLLMIFSGLGFVSFKSSDLLQWGAVSRPQVIEGDWWRLLTSNYLHGGLMHIIMNMMGLFFITIFFELEKILGRIKFITFYLLTGCVASIASVSWYENTVSVGASGAIFGLYGIISAFILTKIYPPEFKRSFFYIIGVSIIYSFVIGLIGGGIDNAAHLGGLISGFTIGLLIHSTIKKEVEEKKFFEEDEEIEEENI